jgi:4'-phosphopantetheinyl transferase
MPSWAQPREVPPLRAGGCQAWWASLADLLPSHVDLLDDGERQRRHQLRRPADRDRLTLGAALLRVVLGAHLGVEPRLLDIDRSCPDCEQPHGRPRPPVADWHCSVSHAGDVEQIDPATPVEDVATYAFAAPERAELAGLADADRTRLFFELWTCKEASVKATGDGLRLPLADLVVAGAGRSPRLVSSGQRPDLPSRTLLHPLDPGPGYVAHLATIGATSARFEEYGAATVLREHHRHSN